MGIGQGTAYPRSTGCVCVCVCVYVCVCVQQRSGPRLSQVPPEHVQLVAAVPVIVVYRYYPGLAIPPALSCR